ncbi:nitrilase-related carbon-nitrogen hydrolase [uncultured Kordia sp.]|uniref:nitrilase-related carbon-nitrogen hydrolase n=1 Tax=uncultured Kordia sp. TaxID=507699 RepID=UPI00260F1F67|nr:nitrilase-related carbon-nitrogen hydrolase [uncultured Kordia sp.]
MNIELKSENWGMRPKKTARILISQPSWDASQLSRDKNQCYQLNLKKENENFIDNILEFGNKNSVDLIVFPEFSIPSNLHERIRKWTSNTKIIVIGGSTYLKRKDNFYNTSPVFYQGKRYLTEKSKLSPHEVSRKIDSGPVGGTKFAYFENTPIGNFAVMICADLFDISLRSKILKKNIDILCVIALQPKGREHHQSIDRVVKEFDEGIYVIYCNALCNEVSDGRSSFFGNDYKEGFLEFKELGLTRNDGIERRAIEMPSVEGFLIVECNLTTKKVSYPNNNPSRSLIKCEYPYVSKNNTLRQLTKEELQQIKPKNIKENQLFTNPIQKHIVKDNILDQSYVFLNQIIKKNKEIFEKESIRKLIIEKGNQQGLELIEREINKCKFEFDQCLEYLEELIWGFPTLVITPDFLELFTRVYEYDWQKTQKIILTSKIKKIAELILRQIKGDDGIVSFKLKINLLKVHWALGNKQLAKGYFLKSYQLSKDFDRLNLIEKKELQKYQWELLDYGCGFNTDTLSDYRDLADNYIGSNAEIENMKIVSFQCSACRFLRENKLDDAKLWLEKTHEKLQLNIAKKTLLEEQEYSRLAYYNFISGAYYFELQKYNQSEKHLNLALKYFDLAKLDTDQVEKSYIFYILFKILKIKLDMKAFVFGHKAYTVMKSSIRKNYCLFDFDQVLTELENEMNIL